MIKKQDPSNPQGYPFTTYYDKTFFPVRGKPGILYVDEQTGVMWRWGGADYVVLGGDVAAILNDSGDVIGLRSRGVALPGSGVELSGLFSAKPTPSSFPVGATYFATDAGLGGLLLRNNGTAWKSVNKSIPLLTYANAAGFSAAASSAEQIFSNIAFIPGGLIESGDKLQFIYAGEDNGTADAFARSIRVRAHTTSAVMSGVTIQSMINAVAANNKFFPDKAAMCIGTTVRSGPGSTSGGYASTTALANVTCDFGADKYIGFTIQNQNTLVPHIVYGAHLILEKGN